MSYQRPYLPHLHHIIYKINQTLLLPWLLSGSLYIQSGSSWPLICQRVNGPMASLLRISYRKNPMGGGAWVSWDSRGGKELGWLTSSLLTVWGKWQPTPVLRLKSQDGGAWWPTSIRIAQLIMTDDSSNMGRWKSSKIWNYLDPIEVINYDWLTGFWNLIKTLKEVIVGRLYKQDRELWSHWSLFQLPAYEC